MLTQKYPYNFVRLHMALAGLSRMGLEIHRLGPEVFISETLRAARIRIGVYGMCLGLLHGGLSK